MKVCNTFELKSPTPKQMTELLYKSLPTLSSLPVDTGDIFVEYIQGDLRKYDFIKRIYEKSPEILLDKETMTNIFHVKSYNDDSKKITQKLIETPVNISRHVNVMNDTDRTIVALLWHENIVDAIAKYENARSIPFYFRILENMCFADFMDRITFQNQIWQFNEMSSMIKTFYNNKIYHELSNNNRENNDEIRFTKVLTKYSTEYNNSIFIYDLCQKLDMDRNDLICFFQELRLKCGENILKNNIPFFEEYNISKLDIKRLYRYLDKNIKKETILEEEDSDDELES